ncbi:MAG: endonuclease, partial [Planctomycetota bacterium]
AAINPGGSIPGWDSGNSWNREHTWPRSRGVNSSGPDNSDLHQLRPSDPDINNSRGNLNFGGEFGQQGFGIVSDGGTYWYPGDADAGMIARQQFYMEVRYDGSDSSTDNLELLSGNPSTNTPHLGNLDRLLEWHYLAAPDDFERRRNDVIFDSYQGNRNPFVDHPEFVWSVFVDQANDSQLSIAGTTASADGSSANAIDLGRVFAGSTAPSTVSVSIDKAGNDGTYYRVTATGDAFTDAGEHARPLAIGAGVSDSFDVGLTVSTAASGLYSGSVVIDNLDVTTAGGAGRGGNDGDDVIDLSFQVVDHPVASFASDTIISATTIDFGSIDLGSGIVEQSLSFFNYNGAGAPSSASELELDSVSMSGDSGTLIVDAMLGSAIGQGGGLFFDALFDTSVAGVFESVVTLNLSGEDLPGEQMQTLTVTLLGEVVETTLQGDINGDGNVDLLDLDILGANFGENGGAPFLDGDLNGDGNIDLLDLDILGANFGQSINPTAIPEPTAFVLVGGLLCAAVFARESRE